jgi:hypothetical protein
MITLKRRAWSMPALSLLLILPPLAIFIASGVFSAEFADPAGHFAQPWFGNGAAEAAGRMKAIAAFMLCAGIEVGVLIIWAGTFRMLDGRSAIRVLAIYLLTVAIGTSFVLWEGAFRGAPYLDQAFACASFDRLKAPDPRTTSPTPASTTQVPRPTPPAAGAPAPAASGAAPQDRFAQVRPENLGAVTACRAPQFDTLHLMIRILGVLLLFGMPAVIFGAICCLATPSAGSREARLEAWTLQTRRLNGFLYLAAVYMISGLLFTNAQLSWIGYSLHPDDLAPYRAYVGSVVLHGGVSNSLIIASYYLPVATWLAASRPTQAKAGAAESASAQADAPDPFGALRIAGTILAPALVGFLAELLRL